MVICLRHCCKAATRRNTSQLWPKKRPRNGWYQTRKWKHLDARQTKGRKLIQVALCLGFLKAPTEYRKEAQRLWSEDWSWKLVRLKLKCADQKCVWAVYKFSVYVDFNECSTHCRVCWGVKNCSRTQSSTMLRQSLWAYSEGSHSLDKRSRWHGVAIFVLLAPRFLRKILDSWLGAFRHTTTGRWTNFDSSVLWETVAGKR